MSMRKHKLSTASLFEQRRRKPQSSTKDTIKYSSLPHNTNTQNRQKRDSRGNNNNIYNNTNGEDNNNTTTSNNNTDTGTLYLQTSAVPGVDGRLIPHITCYNCGRKGHYADNCPGQDNNEADDQQHDRYEMMTTVIAKQDNWKPTNNTCS